MSTAPARAVLRAEGEPGRISRPHGDPPESPGAALREGATAAVEIGDYADAWALYERAIEHAPEDPELLFAALLCAKRLRDVKSALAIGRRLLAVQPKHVPNLLNLADTLCAWGDRIAAEAVLERAEELAPTHRHLDRLRKIIARH